MATNHTTNYNLSQWLPTDSVIRADFNSDNAKLDAALAGLAASKADQSGVDALALTVPRFAAGYYSGDDVNLRVIELGFTPKAVLLTNEWGEMYDKVNHIYWGALAVEGSGCFSENRYGFLVIVDGGFRLTQYAYNGHTFNTNKSGHLYHYIAFG